MKPGLNHHQPSWLPKAKILSEGRLLPFLYTLNENSVTQADMNNWTAGNIAETLTVIVTDCVKIMITSEPTTILPRRNDQNRVKL